MLEIERDFYDDSRGNIWVFHPISEDSSLVHIFHEIQPFFTEVTIKQKKGATTLSIMTIGLMTLSITILSLATISMIGG